MALPDLSRFYIDGAWVEPVAARPFPLIDPATETAFGTLALGSAEDVDRAVRAARAAFPAFSETAPAARVALLRRILALFEERFETFAETIRQEMGSPIGFARKGQAARGPAHLNALIAVMERFAFEEDRGTTRIRREPIGVCGLITPGTGRSTRSS